MNTYLSPKKQRFVDFIKNFTNNENRPPTFVEIMEGLNINSLGTINWYVNELEKIGILKRMNGFNGKRALSILEKKIDNTLPLLGLIAAGYPLEIFDDSSTIEVPDKFINVKNFALKVNGQSMQDDGIIDGDIVIIKKTEVANSGEIVVAYVNGEATLKRYYLRNNQIELHPQNSSYDKIIIKKNDDFRIGGILIGLLRDY